VNRTLDDAFAVRCNAYHEAGHAVAAISHGFLVAGIDIRPGFVPGVGQTLGSAELALPSPKEFLGKGEDAVMPVLVVLLAGVFAEQRINDRAGLDIGHAQSDGQRAFIYAAGAICTPAVRNGVLVTPGEEVQRKIAVIQKSVEKAQAQAQQFVASHGPVIDGVAEALIKVKVVSHQDVESLIHNTMM